MNLLILDGGVGNKKRHLMLDKVEYKEEESNEVKHGLELIVIRENKSLTYILNEAQVSLLYKYLKDQYDI